MAMRTDTQTLLSRVLRASIGIGLVTVCTLAGLALLPADDHGGYAIEHGAENGADHAPTTPTPVELAQRAALAPLEVLPEAVAVRAIANDPVAATASAAAAAKPIRERFTNPLVLKGMKTTPEGFWAAWPALRKEAVARLAAAPLAKPSTLATANARITSLDKLSAPKPLVDKHGRINRALRRDFAFDPTMAWIRLAFTVVQAEAEHAAAPTAEPPFTDADAIAAVVTAYPDAELKAGSCDRINWGSWSAGNTPPPPARSKIGEGGHLGFVATADPSATGGLVTYYACY